MLIQRWVPYQLLDNSIFAFAVPVTGLTESALPNLPSSKRRDVTWFFKMSFLSPRLVVFPGQTLVRARALVKIGSMWVFRWGKWTFHPPSHKSAADRLAVSFLSSLPALLQFISLLVPVMALCTLGERFYFFTWTPEANTTLDVNFNRIPFKFCE